jgi:hypothetical protein
MEPHKLLDGIEAWRPSTTSATEYFKKALAFTRKFYGEQIAQIESIRHENVTPESFFCEYIWVVHATGFSARTVGKFIDRLITAYGHWQTLGTESFNDSFIRVRTVCNNLPKARAVHTVATRMVKEIINEGRSWEDFRTVELSSPQVLQRLPYVGKVTCFHLARNIGLLECVKPDLHLVRLAKYWGYPSCEIMCRSVCPEGMPLGIVDLVFWYAASTFGTVQVRTEGQR